MPERLYRQGLLGEPADTNPYLPFPVALEMGVIKNPKAMAATPHDSLGTEIANGHIPNNKGAGIIDLRDGLVAIDHASIVYTGDRLEIIPAAKDAVSHEGNVLQEGAILMGNKEGLMTLAALAIHTERNPWLAQRLNRHGRRLGGIAVFTLGLEAPKFEIVDVNTTSGIITARTRNRYF